MLADADGSAVSLYGSTCKAPTHVVVKRPSRDGGTDAEVGQSCKLHTSGLQLAALQFAGESGFSPRDWLKSGVQTNSIPLALQNLLELLTFTSSSFRTASLDSTTRTNNANMVCRVTAHCPGRHSCIVS